MTTTKKNEKKRLVITASSALAIFGLARNFYETWLAAFLEPVYNGKDGATRRGVTPEIDIFTFTGDNQHPLSGQKGSKTYVVLDNGCGFTDEVIAAFGIAGQSASLSHEDLEGTHGLGKFAPFATGDAVTRYHIITSTGPDVRPWMFTLDGGNIFGSDGFEEQVVPRGIPHLPKQGPFTMVVVPNADLPDDAVLTSQLTLALPLPIVPFVVRLNGKEVPRRALKASASFTTEFIPALKGHVTFKFAVAELAGDADKLEIMSATGRSVAEVVSPATRSLLNPIFRNPRLVGAVLTPSIGKSSMSNRGGLSARFWKSAAGKALIDTINSFGVDCAKEVLGEERVETNPVDTVLRSVVGAFTTSFGTPIFTSDDTGGHGGGTKDKDKGKGGKDKGKGGKDKGGGNDDNGDEVFVRIEDKTYGVMSFPLTSTTPAVVRGGKIIAVNTNHPEVVRVMRSRSQSLMRELIIRALVEAHVMKTRGTIPDTIGMVYQITAQVHAAQNKG